MAALYPSYKQGQELSALPASPILSILCAQSGFPLSSHINLNFANLAHISLGIVPLTPAPLALCPPCPPGPCWLP